MRSELCIDKGLGIVHYAILLRLMWTVEVEQKTALSYLEHIACARRRGNEKTTEDILAEGLLRSEVLRVALREVIDTLSKLSIERDRYEEYRVRTADLLLVGISVGDDIP